MAGDAIHVKSYAGLDADSILKLKQIKKLYLVGLWLVRQVSRSLAPEHPPLTVCRLRGCWLRCKPRGSPAAVRHADSESAIDEKWHVPGRMFRVARPTGEGEIALTWNMRLVLGADYGAYTGRRQAAQ